MQDGCCKLFYILRFFRCSLAGDMVEYAYTNGNKESAMNFINNPCPRGPGYDIAFLDRAHAEKVRKYHETFPQYAVTPLVSLKHTAAHFGVMDICVKNENARFGLGAFKVLGGSYAIGSVIAQKLGVAPEEMTYELLTDPDT